jgi:DNA-binding transcriptional MerR regulator
MSGILTIGAVARFAGVTPDTIRYYERLGLMPRPLRTPAGYRQYGTGVVDRLTVIRNAQRFGFSLKEIAAFMRIRDGGGTPCRQVRAAGQRILEAAGQQISAMVRARRAMRRTLQAWDQRLAATPANQQARLLEQLIGGPAHHQAARTLQRRARPTEKPPASR